MDGYYFSKDSRVQVVEESNEKIFLNFKF